MASNRNVLTEGGPRDTLATSRKVICMLKELFTYGEEQGRDPMSDNAIAGVFFTLEWIHDALEHAEETLGENEKNKGGANA